MSKKKKKGLEFRGNSTYPTLEEIEAKLTDEEKEELKKKEELLKLRLATKWLSELGIPYELLETVEKKFLMHLKKKNEKMV